jgi:hypothetical protein
MRNVLRDSITQRTKLDVAAGVTTPIDGDVFDARGFTNVVHNILVGALVDTQVTVLKAQHGDLADGSDMADIPNATYTLTDTDDDKVVQLELFKITKPYHRVRMTRGTANAALDGILTTGFNDRVKPDSSLVGATIAAVKVVQG